MLLDHQRLPGQRLGEPPEVRVAAELREPCQAVGIVRQPLGLLGPVPFDGELDEPSNDAQRQILALNPTTVWLSHVSEPWRQTSGNGPPSAGSWKLTGAWGTSATSP